MASSITPFVACLLSIALLLIHPSTSLPRVSFPEQIFRVETITFPVNKAIKCFKSSTPNAFYTVFESAPVTGPFLFYYEMISTSETSALFDYLLYEKSDYDAWKEDGKEDLGDYRKDLSSIEAPLIKGIGRDRGIYVFRSLNFEVWDQGEFVFVLRAKTKPSEETEATNHSAAGDCRPTLNYIFESRPTTCPKLIVPSTSRPQFPVNPSSSRLQPHPLAADGSTDLARNIKTENAPSSDDADVVVTTHSLSYTHATRPEGSVSSGGLSDAMKDVDSDVSAGLRKAPPSSDSSLPLIPSPLSAVLVKNRIVGGNPVVEPAIKNFLAFLRLRTGNCTGIVISKRFILTAAHCSADRSGEVFIGGTNSVSGVRFGISAVIQHPDYVKAEKTKLPLNDLALVKLSRDIPSPALVATNKDNNFPPDNYPVTIAGYGFISEGWPGPAGPKMLKSVDLPIVATSRCVDMIKLGTQSTKISDSINNKVHLCAGYKQGGCDACHGDSGGPVFARDGEGKVLLVGVVSSAVGCARASLPGVSVRISTFRKWIEDTTESPLITSTKTPPKDLDATPISPRESMTPSASNDTSSGTPSESLTTQTPSSSTDENSDDESKAKSSSDKPEAACFPASTTVELESGRHVHMDQVVIGDRVRVGLEGNQFSDVFLFTHRSPSTTHNFIKITASNGKTLSLSPSHYIYANNRMVAASHLKIGDLLPQISASNSNVTVVSVKTVQGVGLYNPHTLHGDIVVDGFAASTYTVAVHPRAAHALLYPVRMLYRLGLVTEKLAGRCFASGSTLTRVLPSGLISVAITRGVK